MTDISKCASWQGCPLADKCYRHTAPEDEVQSWTTFNTDHSKKCAWFMVNDIDDNITLCISCHCMTHTINGKCGKCKAKKEDHK